MKEQAANIGHERQVIVAWHLMQAARASMMMARADEDGEREAAKQLGACADTHRHSARLLSAKAHWEEPVPENVDFDERLKRLENVLHGDPSLVDRVEALEGRVESLED